MPNPNIKPKNRRNWTLIIRRFFQFGFFAFIIVAAIRHNLGGETTGTASIDALCPFGGLETLFTMITSGEYVPKTHPSNIVLGLGLLVGALFSGAAFCGWICPFGTLQDILTGLRKRLHIPALKISSRYDGILRYGRFIVLALVLVKTIETVKLWFADYDPYRTIFSLGWVFDPNWSEMWPAYLVAGLILAGSFFIERMWCKYLCPLGGALSLVGHLSFLRIKRNTEDCKNCGLCNAPCPVGINVAAATRVSTNCIGCLDCVEACPRNASLNVQLSPAWLDSFKALQKQNPLPVKEN